MEILFLFFVGFIFFVALSLGKNQPNRQHRGKVDNSEEFRDYFNSLPEDNQILFMNQLDEVQRGQFQEMLDHGGMPINEELIHEFNNWAEENKENDIVPYELFDPSSYNGSSWQEDNSNCNNSYSDDSNYSNDSYTDFGGSSDWGSSSDSSYSDSSSSGSSSDF